MYQPFLSACNFPGLMTTQICRHANKVCFHLKVSQIMVPQMYYMFYMYMTREVE